MKDFEYFIKNDFSKHQGEWIIVVKGNIVGHGSNLKELLDNFKREYKEETPFVVRASSKNRIV